MSEQDIKQPTTDTPPQDAAPEYKDTYMFSNLVLEKIAGIAAREIDGVLALKGNIVANLTSSFIDRSPNPTRGVSVEVGEENVIVNLKMILEYGAPAPDIFKVLRARIAEQIHTMTGLTLVELHVEVVDVMTFEEFEQISQNRFNIYGVEQKEYANRFQGKDEYGQAQGQPAYAAGYPQNQGYPQQNYPQPNDPFQNY